MGKELPFSMHEKATLRKTLESWRGKKFDQDEADGFDLSKLVGAPCMINVVGYTKKNGEDGVKIEGVSKLMKGAICPEPLNPQQIFSFSDPDWGVFDSLPGFIQSKIKASPEYLKAIQGDQPQAKHSGGSDFEDAPIGEDEPLPF
jgi:hypothetical protein